MSTLVHLIGTNDGFEFNVPMPGVEKLPTLQTNDEYIASFLLPVDFEKAKEVLRLCVEQAQDANDPIWCIVWGLAEWRVEEGR